AHPRDATARHAANHREVAAEKNVAVGLNDQCVNRAARSRTRIETRVQRAVGIEPRKTATRSSVDLVETSGDKNFSFTLDGDSKDRRVWARLQPKAHVKRSVVALQTREIISIRR